MQKTWVRIGALDFTGTSSGWAGTGGAGIITPLCFRVSIAFSMILASRLYSGLSLPPCLVKSVARCSR